MPPLAIDRSNTNIVLIVDDVPDNLSVLHDALDESGYSVLVAINGESALTRARQSLPDIILLDAMMPGMDGFEVARRLKADFATAHIPIIFMTGLTETEHIVAAFKAGGTDYVTKPVRTGEVIARIATHLASARQMTQARSALDAFGQATLSVVPETGRITWQTPLARDLIGRYFNIHIELVPPIVRNWLRASIDSLRKQPGVPLQPLNVIQAASRVIFTLHSQSNEDEWLLVLREESDAAQIEALISAFSLTRKEAEVLYWVCKGKTSPDIGDILGSSPRTVNKHLEHIYEKLGVETRTAAANLAQEKLRR
ncbi:response regulator transcription factor [Uliginosibacterium sp. 31-16]|uniref:response regulator transcription factor n=1 Tax=Uliginosibacterium sp. 31-16 TaxID=3068315 RepID=UPI00273E2F51|nr:response regulator transcription factor [Uliginosibacterium sp. 31-16]MDP5237983.1 response regulator transcription factor [Uliginosibacterium sp. 31-16]